MDLQTTLKSLALDTKFYNSYLIVECQGESAATRLLIEYEGYLALWASLFNKSHTVIKYGEKESEVKIVPASLAPKPKKLEQSMPVTDSMFYTNFDPKSWNKQWLKLFEQMTSCERPQVLIRVFDQRQLWCNNLFADVMRSGGNEIVTRSINDFWSKPDLIKLEQELRTNSDFQINYSARLNDAGLWGNLRADNKIYEFNGVFYRLSTNLECKLI